MSVLLSEPSGHGISGARLLFDLKVCGELIRQLGGQLSLSSIAYSVTDGLVQQFGCAFARLWIVTPDRTSLKLMASSGLYTRLDGSFATVPMGAFKVGKIAQHCIPFLSNDLAKESWVKDRDWAIANQIQGFAGLPLMDGPQAIGVLAIFSQTTLSDEFLEVLQILSIATTGAIATALEHQRTVKQTVSSHLAQNPKPSPGQPPLSEQLSQQLGHQRLSLIGREQALPLPCHQLLLEAAQMIQGLTEQSSAEHYCRLIYEPESICFEVMLSAVESLPLEGLEYQFEAIAQRVNPLGGTFASEVDESIIKMMVQLPVALSPLSSSQSLELQRPGLSGREQEVIELLAQGYRDRDIAGRLYISERTVKFHVKNILAKLAVKTRVQAVYQATKWGWID